MRKSLVRFILVLISVLVSLTLAEEILRHYNYPYIHCQNNIESAPEAVMGVFDDQTGWNYASSQSFPINEKVTYYFDDNGIRIKDMNAQIDYSKPRIVFIGGSVAFGHDLSYEETYAYKIGTLFEDKFEIVNLGVQGYGTDQTVVRLEKLIEDIKPTIILHTFIDDHIKRNINYDRRNFFIDPKKGCLNFDGTKPLFNIKNNQLVQVRKPIEMDKYDQIRLAVLMINVFDGFRESIILKDNKHIEITKALINRIEEIANEYSASVYHIYYSPVKVNPIYAEEFFYSQGIGNVLIYDNFAKGGNEEYFVDKNDNLHPNDKTTTELANSFYQQFGREIYLLSGDN